MNKHGTTKMKYRCVLVLFTCMLLMTGMSIGMFLMMLDTNMEREHDKFVNSFEEYRFVPEVFKATKQNTLWARNVVLDEQEQQLLCIEPHSVVMGHVLEMLIRNLTSCNVDLEGIPGGESEDTRKKTYLKQVSECYLKLPFYDTKFKGVWQNENWRKTVYIVDPLERFVKSYQSHCLSDLYANQDNPNLEVENKCFGCTAQDLECFIRHLYNNYISFLQDNIFKEFWDDETDFYPQFWNCGLEQYYLKYNYISKPLEVLVYLRDYFKAKLNGDLDLLRGGWGHDKKQKLIIDPATHESDKDETASREIMEYLAGNPEFLQKLLTVYAVDYVAFNLDIPTWVQDACPKCMRTISSAADSYRDAYFRHNSKAYTFMG